MSAQQIKTVDEALEHLSWTFRNSPKTAMMVIGPMSAMIDTFYEALKRAEKENNVA